MKIKKYVYLLYALFCVPLVFISCVSSGTTALALLSTGLPIVTTVLETSFLNPGSVDIAARAKWLMKSDYFFKTIGQSGIKISIVMSRDGMDDSSNVYYGSFGMDLNSMWKKPMKTMFTSGSLISASAIKPDFSGMRVSYAGGAYFSAADLNKSADIEVFTNWIGDSAADYRYSPRHPFCEFTSVTPAILKDTTGVVNTYSDTACISNLRLSVDSGFVNTCLLVKYTSVAALVSPPQSFVLDFEIPVIINATLTADGIVDKINSKNQGGDL